MAAKPQQDQFLIRIEGLVQGVGFRPTVWRIASDMKLVGQVLNDGQGVKIQLAGSAEDAQYLLSEIRRQCPPLARIDTVEITPLSQAGPFEGFQIAKSIHDRKSAGIVADAATCPECLDEIMDPADRRAEYAFTNCTHCGPRLSIIRAIPYDRKNTSMASFEMCPACQAEYENPADRRFHAQPNACPECGPQIWFETPDGRLDADAIAAVVNKLKAGKILAIKGIGGFHLACDATNSEAVKMLRQRKARDKKPFAMMARDITQIKRYCTVNGAEEASLTSKAAPIVLLEKRQDASALPSTLAPGTHKLGFMLPYSPLHHLIMADLDHPIVLTSGNLSSEPQVISNDAARQKLHSLVDGYLMHDRDIVNRVDDSVVCHSASGQLVMRRARGLAPAPIRIAFHTNRPILAMGGELKSSFCLLDGNQAILSQHIGDLDEPFTFTDYQKMLNLYLKLYDFRPEIIAIDSHPDFKASQLGQKLAQEFGAELITIQHHEAHFAACLGENEAGFSETKALGIILDGFGLGTDGAIWGGEFFVGNLSSRQHVAQFSPHALLGGDKATQEPWRNAYAHMTAGLTDEQKQVYANLPIFEFFRQKPLAVLDRMLETGLNSPLSSSAGRLFDAVAACLGICTGRQSFEGQAAIELEATAMPSMQTANPYPFEILEEGGAGQLSFAPMWGPLLHDMMGGKAIPQIAANFHLTIAEGIVAQAQLIAGQHGLNDIVLSGGVAQNTILRETLGEKLGAQGYRFLLHHQIPPNDGGIAFGQAVIAAQR